MAKVAFIVDEMFEDSEFRVPYDGVRQAGHEAVIVGLSSGKKLEGKKGKETITTDVSVDEVSPEEFDALVIPGGYSPDKIRANEKMVELTRSILHSTKPVAAICHAGWVLAEADVIRGRTVTSEPTGSIRRSSRTTTSSLPESQTTSTRSPSRCSRRSNSAADRASEPAQLPRAATPEVVAS